MVNLQSADTYSVSVHRHPNFSQVIIMRVVIRKSPKLEKKWRATFVDEGRHVDFGQRGYLDFTIHKNHDRMLRYVARHRRMRENWSRTGRYSAGFWSRWLLWSKPSMGAALQVVRQKLPGYKVTLRRS